MEDDQGHNQPNNVILFRLAVKNCFKHIAESVSESDFLKLLTVLESNPNVAKKLHKAMIMELQNSMSDDLQEILNEGSLQEGLAKMSRLCDANSSMEENVWRPPGNVSLHLRSWDAQKMKEESYMLAEQIKSMEEENRIIMEKIGFMRSKMNAMDDCIARSLNKSPITMESLQKRMDAIEKCLKSLHE